MSFLLKAKFSSNYVRGITTSCNVVILTDTTLAVANAASNTRESSRTNTVQSSFLGSSTTATTVCTSRLFTNAHSQRAKNSLERINAHLEFRKNAQFHHSILEKTILEVQQLEPKENAGQTVIKLMEVEGGVLFMFARVSKKNQRSLFNLAER